MVRLVTLADYPASTSSQTEPIISVVTAVRNGAKTLARTIESIRAQNLPGLEYIVIDACSTDATPDIVRANSDLVTILKIEKDRGISDGFNKGIALSRGRYVTILNADDWLSPGQLAAGIETMERSGVDFVFGDLMYHDARGNAVYRICGEPDYADRIGHVMPGLNHPTVIVRRSAYEKHGLFDLDLRLAMDYEFLLRLHRAGCKGAYDPRMVGHMSLDGASDASSERALAEVREISIRHGEPTLSAWFRYGIRLMRGRTRRILERTIPATLLVRLRRISNRNITELV
jgi:glycosyltransferase involved in cell wall biosynthesis